MKRISKLFENQSLPKSAVVGADGHHVLAQDSGNEFVEEDNDFFEGTMTLPTLPYMKEASYIIGDKDSYDLYESGSFETLKSRSRK